MDELDAVRENQAAYLAKLKKRGKWALQLKGIKIEVFPGVFPPRTDTKLIVDFLRVKKGDRILDIGTGTGAVAVIAGFQGATGIGVDINPLAVKNANVNFGKYHLNMKALQSDMFSSVPKERFDYIFAAGPYLDNQVRVPIDYAIYGMHKFMTELFSSGPDYLQKMGKILATFPEWGDIGYFESLIKGNGFLYRILGKKESHDHQRVYRLYECKK